MTVTETPDLYRISTCVPEIEMQFNQFLVTDDEPLLFHKGEEKTIVLFEKDPHGTGDNLGGKKE